MSKVQQFSKMIGVMNIILILMGLFLFIFTIAMIVIFIKYQAVPDTLITSVFACFGAEGGFMAVIKTAKLKNEKEEIEDV